MLIFNVDANSHHVANLWCSVPVHVLTASGQRLSLLDPNSTRNCPLP